MTYASHSISDAIATGEYLSTIHWQFYGTPTFRSPVSESFAQWAVNDWFDGLGEGAYAYAAFEHGYAGGRLHLHVLVGGLFTGSKDQLGKVVQTTALRFARDSWRFGRFTIEPYNPRLGGAFYVAKVPSTGEILGRPKVHRSRGTRGR